MKGKSLSFAFIIFSESRLFNVLQRIKIKKSFAASAGLKVWSEGFLLCPIVSREAPLSVLLIGNKYSRHSYFQQQIVALFFTSDPYTMPGPRLIRRHLRSVIAPACSHPRPVAGRRRRPESWRRLSDSPTDISIPSASSPASDSGHKAPARRRESSLLR
jgi:hypothetical protein